MLNKDIISPQSYRSFVCILWLLILCLYGTLLSVRACVSGSLYVSCAVSLAIFLLSALSFSDLFVFVLFFIYFIFLLFLRCLFAFWQDTERSVDLNGRGVREELGGTEVGKP